MRTVLDFLHNEVSYAHAQQLKANDPH
jgi:hypothetical protein